MLIYLHIPFCDSKCHYCAFNSYTDKSELKKEYMKSVVKQLKNDLTTYNIRRNSIKTLFIGGGTPSTIKAEDYGDFFETLFPYLKNGAEITTEANPNSATKSWLEGMKDLGTNRISFGIQSFNDEKLKFLGRNHSKKNAIKSIETAKESGFENISLDLIYNTSLDSKNLIANDLKIASFMPINHLSAYSLTIEENTPFYKTPQAAKESVELSKFLFEKIEEVLGFKQYEISNFGTYKSIHNLGYWSGEEYLGIGSGAVGFIKNRRLYPQKSIQRYISDPILKDAEKLTSNDLHLERIFLGLRSIIGVDLNEFDKKELKKIQILLDEKKLTCKKNRVFNEDYLLSDELTLFITS